MDSRPRAIHKIMDVFAPGGHRQGSVEFARKAGEVVDALLADGWMPPEVVAPIVHNAGGKVSIPPRDLHENYIVTTYVTDIGGVDVEARPRPETIQGHVTRPAVMAEASSGGRPYLVAWRYENEHDVHWLGTVPHVPDIGSTIWVPGPNRILPIVGVSQIADPTPAEPWTHVLVVVETPS